MNEFKIKDSLDNKLVIYYSTEGLEIETEFNTLINTSGYINITLSKSQVKELIKLLKSEIKAIKK